MYVCIRNFRKIDYDEKVRLCVLFVEILIRYTAGWMFSANLEKWTRVFPR